MKTSRKMAFMRYAMEVTAEAIRNEFIGTGFVDAVVYNPGTMYCFIQGTDKETNTEVGFMVSIKEV